MIGDDVRSIDWRATARRADVVVRTWRPERDRRVLIVLDTGRTSAVRVLDAPRLDASIEAALLLAALATRAGDRVELLVFDRRVRGRVAGATGAAGHGRVRRRPRAAEPELVETDWPGVVAQVRERLSQRALVVLLTALDPAAVEQGLLPRGRPAHRAAPGGARLGRRPRGRRAARGPRRARPPCSTPRRPSACGLERAAVARPAAAARASRCVEALPDDLAPRLADTYLALKAAGRL